MCIAAASADAGELAQLPLERHQVGDHLDGLDRRGVAVGPASELVQVVADAGDLPGTLALGVGGRRGPRPGPAIGPAQQVAHRQAGRRRFRCQRRGFPAATRGLAAPDGAAVRHRRTA